MSGRRRRRTLAMVVAALSSGDRAPSNEPLALAPCLVGGAAALCGTLAVSENRATNTGRVIALKVAVVPAQGERRPDPVFWLARGPGVAATDDLPGAVRFLQAVNAERDLVFVDQRGTGGSNRFECPQGSDAARWADELPACLADLPADPAAYTTAWAMDDVDEARRALGYEIVNLYGGSLYGATAVQVYLQRHPAAVRSATLIGGTLLDIPIFERFPANSQRALDLALARCARIRRVAPRTPIRPSTCARSPPAWTRGCSTCPSPTRPPAHRHNSPARCSVPGYIRCCAPPPRRRSSRGSSTAPAAETGTM